jgi:hypothetical protein
MEKRREIEFAKEKGVLKAKVVGAKESGYREVYMEGEAGEETPGRGAGRRCKAQADDAFDRCRKMLNLFFGNSVSKHRKHVCYVDLERIALIEHYATLTEHSDNKSLLSPQSPLYPSFLSSPSPGDPTTISASTFHFYASSILLWTFDALYTRTGRIIQFRYSKINFTD